MNRRRQVLRLCLDPAVVVVIQIFNEFPFEVVHGAELLQIQQLPFEQSIEIHPLSDVAADQTAAYIPAGEYLCGYHYGSYLTIQDFIDQLIQEAARRNLPVDDCVITPNIVDQCCEGHPDNYITGLEVRILPLPLPSV